jgi:hypothetical protein
LSIEGIVHFDRGNSYKVGTYPKLGYQRADLLLTKSIEPENI